MLDSLSAKDYWELFEWLSLMVHKLLITFHFEDSSDQNLIDNLIQWALKITVFKTKSGLTYWSRDSRTWPLNVRVRPWIPFECTQPTRGLYPEQTEHSAKIFMCDKIFKSIIWLVFRTHRARLVMWPESSRNLLINWSWILPQEWHQKL